LRDLAIDLQPAYPPEKAEVLTILAHDEAAAPFSRKMANKHCETMNDQ
jgi:hypothetical protein